LSYFYRVKEIVFLFLLYLPGWLYAQNNWESLCWGMSRQEVESQLKGDTLVKSAYPLDTRFSYRGFNVWLTYDSLGQLCSVKQRQTFSVIDREKAGVAFKKTKKEMTEKYGKPVSSRHYRMDCRWVIHWTAPGTEIEMEYDYKYKVIDEFGAGSYWIEIMFLPASNEVNN